MPRPERPLDHEDGALPAFAADLRKLREQAGRPTYRELSRTAHYSVTVLAEAAGGRKLPSLAVTLAYAQACGGDADEWRRRWQEVAEETAIPVSEELPAPYVGLGAFQPDDADRFFGRDKLVRQLLGKITERRFVGLFGASGSGKSSILRAGLVARAEGTTALITPGAHPLEEWRRTHAELVVVDQFEETFTLCQDPDERAAFVHALVHADSTIVIGVRSDFYGHCGQYPELVDALNDAQILVGAMSSEELHEAITQPAVRAGYTVESALVSALAAESAALPLVSHVLLETWRRRRGTRLTLEGYEETGGVRHAIAQSAERVFTGLDPEQQATAKNVLLRLTALGAGTEDTKRRVARDSLGDDPRTATVLEELATARLVTLDDNAVDLTHEALIRSWPRLTGWLDDDRDALRAHHQLTEATAAWESLDRDAGTLYRGVRLALARAATRPEVLTTKEKQFLAASIAAEEAELEAARRSTRRLRQLVTLLTVLLLLAVTAVGYAINAERRSTEQRNLAIARKVDGEAAAIRTTDPALSRYLALAAYRLSPNDETRDALLSAQSGPYANRLTGHTDDVVGLALSPDGTLLASASWDRTVRLWDVTDAHRPQEIRKIQFADSLKTVSFAPAGHTMAVVGDRTTWLWDVSDRHHVRELSTLEAADEIMHSVGFSQDGLTVATTHGDNSAALWNVTDPRRPERIATLPDLPPHLGTPVFSPDRRTLAVATGGTVRMWDIENLREPRGLGTLTGHTETVASFAFSPDSTTVVTGSWDHTGRLWDVRDRENPRELATLSGHSTIVWGVAFSPDGRTVATTGDRSVRLWDVADLRKPRLVTVVPGGVYVVLFTPDSGTIMMSEGSRAVRVQDLRDLPLVGHNDFVSTMAFSPDGAVLATGSWDGTAQLWEVAADRTRRPLARLTGATSFVRSIAFSPDGHTLAVACDDGDVRLWDVRSPREPKLAHTFSGQTTKEVVSVAFSPDGHTLATGGYLSTRLWHLVADGPPIPSRVLSGHKTVVGPVVFSPDGKVLATTSGGDTTKLWDLTESRPRELDFPFDTDSVPPGAFSPDQRLMVTVSEETTVRLVDMSDPSSAREVGQIRGLPRRTYAVGYSPDGRRLVTSHSDGTVRLWDIGNPAKPRSLGTLSGHTADTAAVAFSPDGHTIASGSNDQSVRLWETDADRVADRICAQARPAITEEQWRTYFPDITFRAPCG